MNILQEHLNIINKALLMPPEARSILAASLIESMDKEPDAETEKLWENEITKRVKEIDSNQVRLRPWNEIRNEILAENA